MPSSFSLLVDRLEGCDRRARARASSGSPKSLDVSPGDRLPKCSLKPSRMPAQSQSSGGLFVRARLFDHRADDAIDEIEQALALLGEARAGRAPSSSS